MSLNKHFADLQEKLKASDSMSDWIRDFKKSDAPQFKGKSMEKRRQMAIAAKLGAERGEQNEETYKDTGWKSPERKPGAKTKNVSGRLARQGMKQAEKETKKVKEEVEDLAELSKETLTKYATRARFSSDPKHREGSMKATDKIEKKKKSEKVEEDNKAYRAQDAESKRTTGMSLQQRSKMYDDIQKKLKDQEEEYRKQGILPPKNEAVSQDKKDELRSELGHEDHLPHTVHINGKPWKKFEGHNAGPRAKKAVDTLNAKGKKATYGISEEVDESIGSAVGGAIGQYAGSKLGMDGPGRAHGELAGRAIEYHVRKFAKKLKDKFTSKNEEFSLDESHFKVGDEVICKKSGMEGEVVKVGKPETGKYYTVKQENGKMVKYAPDELKKEKEDDDEKEVKESAGASKSSEEKFHMNLDKLVHKTFGHSPAEKKEKSKKQNEERDPNYEKVDMAKTQAHFIKYAAEEILEYLDMGGEIEEWYQNKLSKVHSDVEGLHSWMEGNKRKEGMVEEIEQVDEVLDSAGKLAGYLGKATLSGLRSAATGTGKFRKRQAGIQRAVDKTKEKINNEEVEELDEDGKLKGGAKDPCWKGYQMVGTKKKGGREVPNCVPREETELKSFKALREKLNVDSNHS